MEKVVTDKRQVTHLNQIEKIYIQHGFDKTRKLEKWKKRRAPSRRGRDIVRVLETKNVSAINSVSMGAPGSRATCHFTDFHET